MTSAPSRSIGDVILSNSESEGEQVRAEGEDHARESVGEEKEEEEKKEHGRQRKREVMTILM